MIVKNEASVITRCLSSVKPLIDSWVIVDTGSTDGTQEIIRDFMKEIPGELYERPWKNFEHNRNEALLLAKKRADYLLIMDADDQLAFEPSFVRPTLTKDAYLLNIRYDELSFRRYQLISTRLPWRWKGVLHEFLTCDIPFSSEILDGVVYLDRHEGARSKDPEKFRKDAAVLLQGLQKEPNNSRYMYYIAQSYKGAEEYDKALTWYQKRIDVGGDDDEMFWSLLQMASCQTLLGKPSTCVIDTLLNAQRLRPTRAEPVYFLAQTYRKLGWYDVSYALISSLRSSIHVPDMRLNKDGIHEGSLRGLPALDDFSICLPWCTHYGIAFEWALCTYHVGEYQACLEACDSLLANRDLPQVWRKQIEQTRCLASEAASPSWSAG
jgi:glycosyltransferase involved in cell wall biosynthesis